MQTNYPSGGFPLGFAMALSSNQKAFSAFLSLSTERQDEILGKAKEVKTIREMNRLVSSLSQETEP